MIWNNSTQKNLATLVRGALTAIDHNYNVNRPQAHTKDGKPRFNIINTRLVYAFFSQLCHIPVVLAWS